METSWVYGQAQHYVSLPEASGAGICSRFGSIHMTAAPWSHLLSNASNLKPGIVGWNIAAETRLARPHRSLTPVIVDALADLESLQPDLEAYYARYGPLYARGPCGASRPSLPGARTVARIHNPHPEQLCWKSSCQ